MTRQELTSLPIGAFVDHKTYGVCLVEGHSLTIGVDLIILSDKTILGRKDFCEIDPMKVTKVFPNLNDAMEHMTGLKAGSCPIEFRPGLNLED